MRYEVELSSTIFVEVEADSEEDAIEQAMEDPENAEKLLYNCSTSVEEL
jgi:hypothetical protein